MLKLTTKNYHSQEANREYMSRSQFQGFLECEAKEMARLAGEWEEEKSTALLVGSYVHSWNEGTRREFISDHPEMFKKDGNLKSEYCQADRMIVCLESDPLAMYMLEGQKEVIFTAWFAGAMWKVMVDAYNPDRQRMVDLKTTRSITEHHWSDVHHAKVSFVEQYNYVLQAALYCEIERLANGREDWLDFYAVAVSKETVPDKAVIDLRDPDRYQQELDKVMVSMPRIILVKSGVEKPIRCECCDYCRSTKVLAGAVHYSEL